ncbi:hypothetical protein BOO69_16430 [Sulfitobacter alexandrii]|uniref:Phosphate ABC transporter substrate-binding protein n=2 Tax=Sulfitobacter alexandrii TaxID=1917485 RepID=A0A1J0WMI5_9RHOB|nr:hypothetical protein BOO69_16430 [Sulfitobacter alexandrii]
MIASLMMYLRPETEAAHLRYWDALRRALRARGVPAPAEMCNAAEAFSVWTAPDLVLSQTCGMPFRTRLHDRVTLVGTPDFGVDGCPPGYYRSAVVVRADDARPSLRDFADARFAFNDAGSQSGLAAMHAVALAEGFWFGDRRQTGGHRASALAVAEGEADIAALDAVTWRLIRRYDPFAAGLRVLTWTPPTPGLPYITGPGMDRAQVFDAVVEAIEHLTEADRDVLGLLGLVDIPARDYLAIRNPPPGDL